MHAGVVSNVDMNTTWIPENSSRSDDDTLARNRSTGFAPPPNEAVSVDYAVAAIYWMIFVAGVSGNVLALAVVVWKLIRSPQHRAMAIFVGSLAVSDLGLLLWVAWLNALLSVDRNWRFGGLACRMFVAWRSAD